MLRAGRGDAVDDRGRLLGHQAAHAEIVEEKERAGAQGQDIVDAVVDQVAADGIVAVQRDGHLELGADAVGRANQRLALAGRAKEGTERADTAQHARRIGRLHGAAHQIDGALAGRDIDAGRGVGATVPASITGHVAALASILGYIGGIVPARVHELAHSSASLSISICTGSG